MVQGAIALPGYGDPGDLFCRLCVTEQHGTGEDYDPSPDLPANLFSVRAFNTEGISYVLTDHGTRNDADACAKLLSYLTGLPVEA